MSYKTSKLFAHKYAKTADLSLFAVIYMTFELKDEP